jgi:hypothetical protein
MPSPRAISQQPAHTFSPARPLRAQRNVAGGGGVVVFLLGPNLTDLVPSFATTNALCPATRFGTDDVTTGTETRDALHESEWRWLRRVGQRLTVCHSGGLGYARSMAWEEGGSGVEVRTLKLSCTRSTISSCEKLGATSDDGHGAVETR